MTSATVLQMFSYPQNFYSNPVKTVRAYSDALDDWLVIGFKNYLKGYQLWYILNYSSEGGCANKWNNLWNTFILESTELMENERWGVLIHVAYHEIIGTYKNNYCRRFIRITEANFFQNNFKWHNCQNYFL